MSKFELISVYVAERYWINSFGYKFVGMVGNDADRWGKVSLKLTNYLT